jgi:glyoxylase-like metal-dependent hydrolase (beta-lactamase superfamily II)
MSTTSYRFTVGTFECTIVNDGNHTYTDPARRWFVNAPQEQLERVLRDYGLDPEQWTEYASPYPSLVIDTGEHRALVDTGAGNLMPTTGKLIPGLQAEGIAPDEIDTVVLTHAHPDHIGGTVDSEGRPAFPNARYVLWRVEWEFWTAEPDLSHIQIDEQIKQLIVTCARSHLSPIQGQLDLLDLADSEPEIVPGIHAVAALGHTPGQIAVVVCSQGERLLCVSDAIVHPIHVEQPGWYIVNDVSTEQALSSRRRLLQRAATERALVHGFHFPFPGLGYVVPRGDGWQWQPIEMTGTNDESQAR